MQEVLRKLRGNWTHNTQTLREILHELGQLRKER